MNEHKLIVTICNKKGLHARASAKIVEKVKEFNSDIKITKDGESVNASSIMGMLMLGAGVGSNVEISANGDDAKEAILAMKELVESRFGEID